MPPYCEEDGKPFLADVEDEAGLQNFLSQRTRLGYKTSYPVQAVEAHV
jgi:hypothetical protein